MPPAACNGGWFSHPRAAWSTACDVCYEWPTWLINADRDPDGPASWQICNECKALVDRGQWDLLALRKLRAWELHHDSIGGPNDVVRMREFCYRIRRYMTGMQPIRRVD